MQEESDYPFFRNEPAVLYCHDTTYLHVLHKQILERVDNYGCENNENNENLLVSITTMSV